ncbi:MAG: TetR/AcrR family transcriptional regulator [Rhodospirillaceae bacterium]|nr:TetR/AcrR family transcriptional regulator [Rhodospirillaceae bacterium]
MQAVSLPPDRRAVDAKADATPARLGETRERLVLAAEKLFAQNGIDAVSLRQINAAAGQKNASAAHYHFGSKPALIAAVYDYRIGRINARRLALLAALDASGRPPDLRALVEAVVHPMVEEIETAKGGKHYIRFVAQARGHPAHDLGKLTRSRHASAMQQFNDRAQALLPHVPPEVFAVRFGLMIVAMTDALADRHRLLASPVTRASIPMALFVSILVDTLVAGLAAPVSVATRSELDRTARRRA